RRPARVHAAARRGLLSGGGVPSVPPTCATDHAGDDAPLRVLRINCTERCGARRRGRCFCHGRVCRKAPTAPLRDVSRLWGTACCEAPWNRRLRGRWHGRITGCSAWSRDGAVGACDRTRTWWEAPTAPSRQGSRWEV